uniref:Uncharacterized protein n=1 Tax=Panagrolaimus sp. PS1159 TaxID=55785 RepID=A0AC35GP51_9BILA
MDKVVIACYNSTDSNHILQGDCAPGQCMFKAGVSKDKRYGTNLLWFMSESYIRGFGNNDEICENANMMSPAAKAYFTANFPSCDPLKHDGNVVKLYVIQAPPGCPLYVLNAKKWIHPTTTVATQNSSALLEINQTTSKSSEADTALWIGIGVGIYILLFVIFGL